ncbi:MAG: Uma2 family endonuclease [Polyangiaceae bacterium]
MEVTPDFSHARYTRAEYRAVERSSNVKHEFLEGAIRAMAGGTRDHALVSANVIASLNLALRGRPCAVHSSDLRIRVVDTGLETYPDASVLCGHAELDSEDSHVVLNPVLLVEVTSPSTEAYDRGKKVEHYERIVALQEIVLVSHREKLVEVLRREGDGSWSRHEARRGEAAQLRSIGCELAVDEVYRDPLAAG